MSSRRTTWFLLVIVAMAVCAFMWTLRDSRAPAASENAAEVASRAAGITKTPPPATDGTLSTGETRSDMMVPRDATAGEPPLTETATSDAIGPSFDERLEQVAATFLGDNPDFLGLARVWDEVGATASVVAESVKHDGTLTTGELTLPNSDLRANFQIDGEHYRVEFSPPVGTADRDNFIQKTVTLNFRVDSGVASGGGSTVQYHPNTGKSALEVLSGGTERLLGWRVAYKAGQLKATPLSAWIADDGRSWAIGWSQRRPAIDAAYGVDGRAEQALLQTLTRGVR